MNKAYKILIAFDGINPVGRLIDDLVIAGLPSRASVTLLTVSEGVMPSAPAGSGASQVFSKIRQNARARAQGKLRRARGTAARAAARVRKEFPGWRVTPQALLGSPASVIIREARERRSDLIVLGSHGRPGPFKFLLGSTAQAVAAAAPCSVRVARGRSSARRAVKLMIAADGSSDSGRVIDVVASRVWPRGSHARLVTVIDSPMQGAVFVPAWSVEKWVEEEDRREDAWIRRMTARFGEKLKNAGLDVSVIVKVGNPKVVIVEEASRWDADCVHVGARGLNRIEKLLMGSVSSSVVVRADCSVEVTRKGGGA